jgi:hypothetical protein
MNQDSYKPVFTYECLLYAKDLEMDTVRGLASQELLFFLEYWFKSQNFSKTLLKSLKIRITRVTLNHVWSRDLLFGKEKGV